MPAESAHEDDPVLARVVRKTTPAAALAALGIVYGDLGTSPLYTLQAIVSATGGHFSPEAALGSLSLIFWLLFLMISMMSTSGLMVVSNVVPFAKGIRLPMRWYLAWPRCHCPPLRDRLFYAPYCGKNRLTSLSNTSKIVSAHFTDF
jgi:hypothetical protein